MKKLLIVATCALLLTACGVSEERKEVDKSIEGRFTPDSQINFIIDTKTGCEYIGNSGAYTSWTYVHGSCPEVIAEEQGITNSK